MKKTLLSLTIALSALSLTSCEEQAFREGKVFAGGKYVSAQTLNKGKQIYTEYCMACHGDKGDGKGVAHKGLATPPRDFTLGIIKFGDVVSGELPHDESIYKTLNHGLNGTAMLPWDLKPGQLEAVWQYIKTFAPKTWEGKDKKLGEKITGDNDPFGLARRDQAIKMGKEVYHVTANCQSCHRGYVNFEELNEMTKRLTGDSADELDDEFYALKPQESDHNYLITPPDFTFHEIRSVKGLDIKDIYVRLAAGVGGTAMPAWKDTITEEEIWAVSYYVQSLMEKRNTPARKAMIGRLGQ